MTDHKAIEMLEYCKLCGDCIPCGTHDEAIDIAISALKEREERAMNWISVEERLPEHNQRVLICYKFRYNKSVKIVDLAFFQEVGEYDEADGKRNVFCYDSHELGHCPYEHVTHWMPLPEPPKEEA